MLYIQMNVNKNLMLLFLFGTDSIADLQISNNLCDPYSVLLMLPSMYGYNDIVIFIAV